MVIPVLLHFWVPGAPLSDRMAARAIHPVRSKHRVRDHGGHSLHAGTGSGQPRWRSDLSLSTSAAAPGLRPGGIADRIIRDIFLEDFPLGGGFHGRRRTAADRTGCIYFGGASDGAHGVHASRPGLLCGPSFPQRGGVGRDAVRRQYPGVCLCLFLRRTIPDALARRIEDRSPGSGPERNRGRDCVDLALRA